MSHDPDIVLVLERGMELWNKREFFEAHEVWEEKWIDAYGDERHLLQGLIQVAAGFYKLQIGQPAGTFKLLEKGAGHLRAVPADYYNIDLAGLLSAVDWWKTYARELVDSFRTDFDAGRLPTLAFRPQ
jgi:predicted metal-dependent hydrolase